MAIAQKERERESGKNGWGREGRESEGKREDEKNNIYMRYTLGNPRQGAAGIEKCLPHALQTGKVSARDRSLLWR